MFSVGVQRAIHIFHTRLTFWRTNHKCDLSWQSPKATRRTECIYLEFLAVQKVGGCMHNVSSVSGVVIRILGVIVGLDELQPAQQHFLVGAKEIDNSKPLQCFHSEINQRTATHRHPRANVPLMFDAKNFLL